jgi:DtxR family Mn-dependent transcriptional regulator
VVHLEDEPVSVYRRLLGAGLELGSEVFLYEVSPDQILVWVRGDRVALRPQEAKNVVVRPDPGWRFSDHEPGESLADMTPGEAGVVIDLSPALRGQERRRLMDMGVVPGTYIRAEFASPGGDPTAYQVRGALLALRKEQAQEVRVQREERRPA